MSKNSKKLNFKVDLIAYDVCDYDPKTKTNNYLYEAGQIFLHYEFNVKPKKLYSKIKPILKQQQNNIGLLYILIQHKFTHAKLYPVNNVVKSNATVPLTIKRTITFTNEDNLPTKQYLQKCFE